MIRPPVKWHGGKHYLAKQIVACFPPHHTYVEPFGGAASVLLNKEPSPVEVYNDLDSRIVNLFKMLRDRGDEFRQALALTPYAEGEFIEAIEGDSYDTFEQARRDYVRWRQSIGGRGDAWSQTLHRVRRGMADVVSGYLSSIDEALPSIAERLRRVQITCRPAAGVIERWDSPTSLIYCDPPYVASTRQARDVYAHEMTDAEHEELAKQLNDCKSAVVLSGYDSALYRERYRGWRCIKIKVANHAASGKTKRMMEECLWTKRCASAPKKEGIN